VNLTCNLIGILVGFVFLFLYSRGNSSESSSNAAQMVYHVYQLLAASSAAFFPLMCVFGHPELRQRAKMLLICFRRGPSIVPLNENVLRNAIGRILIPNQRNERELHFVTLNDMWNFSNT
jgi:hypothetical protein